jgi:hypothetical protein
MLTFERSPDTEAAVVALRGINELTSYETLAKRAGLKVARLKGVLPSARRILRAEKMLFGIERGIGVRRMADLDKVRKSEDTKKRMSRTAKRGIKELETIEHFELLAPPDQLVVTTNRTIFHLIQQQSGVKNAAIAAASPTAAPTGLAENLVKLGRK